MKTIKIRFIAVAVIVLVGSTMALGWSWHSKAKQVAAFRPAAGMVSSKEEKPALIQAETPLSSVATPLTSSPTSRPLSSPALSASGAKTKTTVAKSAGQKPPPLPKESIQDPLAREALNYVGADPLAEQYWVSAINDRSLPAEERKDLIEDLNEDGFADPKHLTRDDVPLIISRLQLIEDLAPGSMDQVNNDAFQEAYKDLVNMLAKAP